MILYVRRGPEPSWPATDTHPQAKRFQVGDYVVDAVGNTAPTLADVEAAANPQKPFEPSIEQLMDYLTDAEKAALTGPKPLFDILRLTARGNNGVPITNSKLARLATAAGTTPEAWFARVPR